MSVKILHAITTLDVGGAENMLVRLLEAGTRDEFEPSILSLMDPDSCPGETLVAQATSLRVPLFTLGLAQGDWHVAALWRLARILRTASPELLQGWMYHGNLTATIGSWLLPRRPPVLWNVRHSLHDLALEKPLTRLIIRLSSRLSRLPQAIIYNSRVSAAQHARLGFDASRAVVIPNGFNGTQFRPQPEAGRAPAPGPGHRSRPDGDRPDRARPPYERPGQPDPRRGAAAGARPRGPPGHHRQRSGREQSGTRRPGARERDRLSDIVARRAHRRAGAGSPASMSPRCRRPGAKASPTFWARRWPAGCHASPPTSVTAAGWSGRTASSCRRARARRWRTPLLG